MARRTDGLRRSMCVCGACQHLGAVTVRSRATAGEDMFFCDLQEAWTCAMIEARFERQEPRMTCPQLDRLDTVNRLREL